MNAAGNASTTRLRDLAVFVRSKNAGPFMLTIDVFFEGPADCQRVIDSGVITPQKIASLYAVAQDSIKIIHVVPAHALKISFPRPLPAGDVGDSDVAGGQQFVPLLNLEFAVR